MRKITIAFTALLSLAGTASAQQTSPDDIVESNLSTQREMARIYIFPTIHRSAIFGTISVDAKIYISHANEDSKHKIGATRKGRYLAIAVKPGDYRLLARPLLGAETDSSNLIHATAGDELFLRPISHNSGAELGLIGIGVASVFRGEKPQFEIIPPAQAKAELTKLERTTVDKEAPEYVME